MDIGGALEGRLKAGSGRSCSQCAPGHGGCGGFPPSRGMSGPVAAAGWLIAIWRLCRPLKRALCKRCSINPVLTHGVTSLPPFGLDWHWGCFAPAAARREPRPTGGCLIYRSRRRVESGEGIGGEIRMKGRRPGPCASAPARQSASGCLPRRFGKLRRGQSDSTRGP